VKKPTWKKAPVKGAPEGKSAPVKKEAAKLKGKVAKKESGPEAKQTWDALKYNPHWKAGPRKFGCVTVYTDTRNELYRIKPGIGRRDHTMRKWGSESWLDVVKIVKTLPQC